MTAGALFVLALAAAGAAFIVAPLLRRGAADAERVAAGRSAALELESARSRVLGALRDLEEDRATGKLGPADYAELHARLTARALEILKRADELRERAPRGGAPGGPVPHTRSRPGRPA